MRKALLLGALLAAACAPALANGTARIQQSDGTIKVYSNIHIAIVSRTLHVTSGDGKGTFVINRAACSMVGELMRCLPDQATLKQFGETREITLRNGTIWYNRTQTNQQLPLSSMQLAPHGILLSMTTQKGTYVSLDGTVDEITK